MDQILPYPLWVGHAEAGTDHRRLFDAGIRALVELAVEEPSVPPPREIIYGRFPLVDGTGNDPAVLYLAVQTVEVLVRMHVPTLVRCGGGVSRAPAVAAAAMAAAFGESAERCLQRIVDHHATDVSPGLWSEVTGVLGSMR
jgi:hypothetical protein